MGRTKTLRTYSEREIDKNEKLFWSRRITQIDIITNCGVAAATVAVAMTIPHQADDIEGIILKVVLVEPQRSYSSVSVSKLTAEIVDRTDGKNA